MAVQSVEHADLQLVVFSVEESEFAVHISLVREIINISKIVALPYLPHAVVGIIDVRGAVVPVVNLGRKFGLVGADEKDFRTQKVLLVEFDGSMVGYLVDEVSEVLQVPAGSIEKTTKIASLHSGAVESICNLEED